MNKGKTLLLEDLLQEELVLFPVTVDSCRREPKVIMAVLLPYPKGTLFKKG